MRYPLWAFFFILVMPPFAAHALLTGKAALAPSTTHTEIASSDHAQASGYWTHVVIAR